MAGPAVDIIVSRGYPSTDINMTALIKSPRATSSLIYGLVRPVRRSINLTATYFAEIRRRRMDSDEFLP